MKRRLNSTFFTFISMLMIVLLVSFACNAQNDESPENFTIERITIIGNSEMTEKEIKDKLGLQESDVVTKSNVQEKISSLKDSGYFRKLEFSADTSEGNMTLEIKVEEYPVLQEIEFEGAESIKFDKLKEVLNNQGIQSGELINQNDLKKALEKIVKKYNDEGYPFVTIGNIEIGETLTIEVIEGKLASIRIEGLETIPKKVATDLIDIPIGKTVKLENLQKSYQNLQTSVYFSSIELSPARGYSQSDIILRWQLTEQDLLSKPVEASKLIIKGNTVLSEKRIQKLIKPLPDNKEVSNYELLQVLEPVYDQYIFEGYVYVDFSSTEVNDNVITVELAEGVVQSVNVNGNERTAESIITNKLSLTEGTVYNTTDASNSRRRILNLGYFNDVNLEPTKAENGVTLDLKIKEKNRLNSINGGLTWSESGLAGKLSLSTKNLFGLGQDLSVNIKRGFSLESKLGGSIDWKNVYYPEQFNFTELSIYRNVSNNSSISQQGAKGTIGYPLSGNLSLNMSYNTEWVSNEGNLDSPLTNILTGNLIYDNRNNPLFPTSGSRRSFSIEKAGDFAPGNSFTKLTGEWRQFSQLPTLDLYGKKRQTIGLRLRSGLGFDVPNLYKIGLGGPSTLRGYGGRLVDNYAFANAEYRLQLLENSLFVTTFVDSGIVFTGDASRQVVSSAGFEVNLQFFGNLRVGAAWPLNEDLGWVPTFYFGVGPTF